MFTGITEQVGKIESLQTHAEGGTLSIAMPASGDGTCGIAHGLKLGDSVSVNGCCLTVTALDAQHFSADLSGETLRRTNFSEKKPGDLVNLEPPLAAGGRLGGHFMQGHVDGIGRIMRLAPEGQSWRLSVSIPENLRRYIAPKGSIAIDGISLTVAKWGEGILDIAVIPFTYQHTNIHAMTAYDAVNIETDILAKYVESLQKTEKAPAAIGLTVKQLIEEGF